MFRRVSIVHGIIILLAIVLSTFHGCTPKRDNVTWLSNDIGSAPAPAPPSEPEADLEPAPEIKSEKPKPEKKLTPKPVATNKPPETVKTNAPPKKTAVTNAPPKKAETNAPAKPKTLEERLADVRKGGKPVAAKPSAKSAPPIDYSGLRNALNSAAAGSGSASGAGSGSASGTGSGSGGGMYSPFAGYYDSVEKAVKENWQQPSGVPIGTTAIATIRVERSGMVSMKSITRRSGNALFDQSVQNALNATTQLPPPPADLPSNTIEIEFVLSD